MSTAPVTLTLAAVVKGWPDAAHRKAATCPGCGEDVTRVGLTSLAYVFDTCACTQPGFDHLVEQMWHRACLVKAERP